MTVVPAGITSVAGEITRFDLLGADGLAGLGKTDSRAITRGHANESRCRERYAPGSPGVSTAVTIGAAASYHPESPGVIMPFPTEMDLAMEKFLGAAAELQDYTRSGVYNSEKQKHLEEAVKVALDEFIEVMGGLRPRI